MPRRPLARSETLRGGGSGGGGGRIDDRSDHGGGRRMYSSCLRKPAPPPGGGGLGLLLRRERAALRQRGDDLGLDVLGDDGAAVLRVVHAHVLLLGGAADADGDLEAQEEGRRRAADPDDDEEDEEDGREEAAAVAAVEDARAVLRAVAVVGLLVVELRGEEGRGDDAPGAAGAVHGEGVDDVVDAELDEELRRPEVDGRGDRADDERAPERHDGAGRRDGHEAREDAVVRVARVDDAVDGVAQGRRREAARRGRDRRRHHDVAREAAVASDRERRDAVEAVPADPEDERAQGLVDDGLLGQALLPVAARADERGADERRDAAGHVDDAAAREVDDAAVADEAVAAPGRELARAGPAHVDGHGVDEARDDDGVDDVRAELAALRDRAGDDGRRGAGEGPLEEPERLAVGLAAGRRRRAVDVEELRRADEAVRAVVAELVRAERDAVAEEPPHDGGDGRVEDVLDEDVLRVLELHGPDLEHREARLHEEDEDHAEEEPEGVGVPGGEEERGVVVEAVVALEGGDASFQGGEIRHGVL
mmetsp:Transcript_26907/g.88055  ORF Transcript_26907/g.88055 Transcript_26907/m.88055 type:complete len:536 (-) Transcript_26907:48-1655(-)